MILLAFYDIESNKIRTKVANGLEKIGFTRIQKSVFAGRPKVESLNRLLKNFLPKLKPFDKLFLTPITKTQLKNMVKAGEILNMDVIAGVRNAVVL
jgi:CRISPR-associated endonuclease Cas2